MGVFMWIFPCQSVASHDYIFTPVGTAMMIVVIIMLSSDSSHTLYLNKNLKMS